MLKRRTFVQAALVTASLPRFAFAAPSSLQAALQESPLIYVTPIKSNGDESKCQSEVWFVYDGADIFVCTKSDSWRATAPGKGLDRANIWVGDVGVWRKSKGKYKSLPRLDAQVSTLTDSSEYERILDLYSDKYSLEWLLWGPRFRNGLADGSRTMLRYRPLTV